MQKRRVTAVRVYGLHKSGTMFLYQFFRDVSRRKNFEFYSDNNDPPDGLPVPVDPANNYCVCPIRTFDDLGGDFPTDIDEYRVVQIRDPRDMLVSEYFSFGWSHGGMQESRKKEIRSMSIDDYVLNQPVFSSWPLDAKLKPFLDVADHPRTIIVKYETMTVNFPAWVAKAIKPFGFSWSSPLVARRLARKYRSEFLPTGNRKQHKRAVLPGDHLAKLKKSTIEALNERFDPFLTKYGYATDRFPEHFQD